jgi:hypothetical protein
VASICEELPRPIERSRLVRAPCLEYTEQVSSCITPPWFRPWGHAGADHSHVEEELTEEELTMSHDDEIVASLTYSVVEEVSCPHPFNSFPLLLIGYLDGITSERRLAREISLNLVYRWFVGYAFDQTTPHSVLTKARARFATRSSRSSSRSPSTSEGRPFKGRAPSATTPPHCVRPSGAAMKVLASTGRQRRVAVPQRPSRPFQMKPARSSRRTIGAR